MNYDNNTTDVEEKTERDIEELLIETLNEHAYRDVLVEGTFEDYGLMTRNKGVVLKTPNGEVFQITIVRSR